jgi:Na+/glutamate symporter
MTIDLSFLAAVALAGLAYLLGAAVVPRIPLLNRYFLPEPLLGGSWPPWTF